MDTGFLTEFQTGDCQVTFQDPEGIFSTAKASNFFTDRNWSPTGYLARFELFGGFKPPKGELEEELVFKGSIINIEQNAKTRDVTITASENAEISREDVNNFGIQKGFVLPEGDQDSIHGVYEFASQLSPVAEDSALPTLKGENSAGTAVSQFMSQKNVLDTFGDLKETNFAVTDGAEGSELLTEEAVTSLTDVEMEARFKAPLRYSPIFSIVRRIANYYNVHIEEINVPEPDISTYHFTAMGRVPYKITYSSVAQDADGDEREFAWHGEITDFISNVETRCMYLLLSDRDDKVKPRLIEFDTLNDSVRVLTTADSHAEWWKLATEDYSTFYILQSESEFEGNIPALGTYNPSEYNAVSSAQTSILKYDMSAGTRENKVNTGNVYRPQLAMYYHYGFTRGTGTTYPNNERLGFLPDTRHNFMFARGVLWYRFASRAYFGLARYDPTSDSATREILIPRDGRNNEASFDFTIDVVSDTEGTIYGSHTSRTDTESRLLVYKKALADSY